MTSANPRSRDERWVPDNIVSRNELHTKSLHDLRMTPIVFEVRKSKVKITGLHTPDGWGFQIIPSTLIMKLHIYSSHKSL